MASASMSRRPPAPHVAASESGSISIQRRQPGTWDRSIMEGEGPRGCPRPFPGPENGKIDPGVEVQQQQFDSAAPVAIWSRSPFAHLKSLLGNRVCALTFPLKHDLAERAPRANDV